MSPRSSIDQRQSPRPSVKALCNIAVYCRDQVEFPITVLRKVRLVDR